MKKFVAVCVVVVSVVNTAAAAGNCLLFFLTVPVVVTSGLYCDLIGEKGTNAVLIELKFSSTTYNIA